ncbi:MAG: SAM-dependent methyltransferase, partial [Verrucomicrobiota bacterium]
GARHLALATPLIRGASKPWPVPFDRAVSEVLAHRGRPVCILASGDPFYHGVGALLSRHVSREEILSVPAPCAFSLAASRLAWPLPETVLLSLCGRSLDFVRPHLHPAARILALVSDGETPAVLFVIALLLWRAFSKRWNPRQLCNPIFVMMVLGWVLGLKMRRFWWDYGIPAFMLWVAFELQDQLEGRVDFDSVKRLLVTLALAAGFFLGFTSDRDGRWTQNLTTEFLTPDNQTLAGWLPDPGGIIYNSDMDVFFQTFYANPKAPWRYVLGFEPGLMLPEDLAVLRKAQWNFGDARAYQPWVDKMRPQDRLIIRATGGARPNLPELEWNYAATETWIGRLPRPGNNSAAPSPR